MTPTVPTVHGIHHITCIAGDPQANVDFYVGVLGLRLVKRSVNQDSPDTYHLFYADAVGSPGTDLTFFPWPRMEPARPGIGLAADVSLAVPSTSLPYWRARLSSARVAVDAEPPAIRFGEPTLRFHDPDGLPLALVGIDAARPFTPWDQSGVPAEHQIRGLHAVRILERDMGPTVATLTTLLGMKPVGIEDGWHRFSAGDGGSGTLVDVKELPDERRGTWGPGGIHHVAWRVADVDEGLALRQIVEEAGLRPTPVIDRFWFESIYFKEPGGALFELATEGPGFGRDEDMAHLGERLILPPWLEVHRGAIEAGLPRLTVPSGSQSGSQ